MGVVVESMESEFVEIRPFKETVTFQNLQATESAVVHLVDDANLICKLALNLPVDEIEFEPANEIAGQVMQQACQAWEVQVQFADTLSERASFNCRIRHRHHLKPFSGLNRAAMALIEATILATRLDFIPLQFVREKLSDLEAAVSKTGSPQHLATFQQVCEFVDSHSGNAVNRSEAGRQ